MTRSRDSHNTPDHLLTYAEAAALLKLKPGTLYSLVHHKQVPHVRLGRRIVRFQRAALLDWLESRVVEVRVPHEV